MTNITYTLLFETARDICERYGKDIAKMEEWEIQELVDKIIDDALYANIAIEKI